MSYILRFRKDDDTFLSDDRIEQICNVRLFRLDVIGNVLNEGEGWHFQYRVRFIYDLNEVVHQIMEMYTVTKLEIEYLEDPLEIVAAVSKI